MTPTSEQTASRNYFCKNVFALAAIAVLTFSVAYQHRNRGVASAQEPHEVKRPLEIGDRRELFVDDYLIASLSEGARRQLHHPVPGQVVLKRDVTVYRPPTVRLT